MDREEIFIEVQKIFDKILEREDVDIKESYSKVDVDGWDSLTHIMLIVETEKRFNIKFLSSEVNEWKTIGEMIDSIENIVGNNS